MQSYLKKHLRKSHLTNKHLFTGYKNIKKNNRIFNHQSINTLIINP